MNGNNKKIQEESRTTQERATKRTRKKSSNTIEGTRE
jgi:hypothetical protein